MMTFTVLSTSHHQSRSPSFTSHPEYFDPTLKQEERFFAPSGNIYAGGPSTWHIMDWDQRRLVSVTIDEELESEDPAIEHLQKHIDDLAPDVFEIRISPLGDLVSTSTDQQDDNTRCPYHPPLEGFKDREQE
ncbi:kinase-like domain-containing protein [Fusarium mundagurra]|uniref:Kinase-like domain-containing protein n=1 Tax=Fusarium mundagurra TaxID=1567541 RepID=A0A8H5YG07_9HYPO|nr:kinase-like domain-containing protein [Fusarium mundagurra]